MFFYIFITVLVVQKINNVNVISIYYANKLCKLWERGVTKMETTED